MLADNVFTDFFAPESAMQVNFNVAEEKLSEIEIWIAEYATLNARELDYISRDTLKADFAGLQTYSINKPVVRSFYDNENANSIIDSSSSPIISTCTLSIIQVNI